MNLVTFIAIFFSFLSHFFALRVTDLPPTALAGPLEEIQAFYASKIQRKNLIFQKLIIFFFNFIKFLQ